MVAVMTAIVMVFMTASTRLHMDVHAGTSVISHRIHAGGRGDTVKLMKPHILPRTADRRVGTGRRIRIGRVADAVSSAAAAQREQSGQVSAETN